MSQSTELGTQPIGKLLWQQALPASMGILIMSIYGIVDTIFIGRYVGPLGIAAITVVMPIVFLISSIGMAIGVGGGSIISRALGADDESKACRTFGNMASITLGFALFMIGIGFFFENELLALFGGKGDIVGPAREYLDVLLPSLPFLAFSMMSNNVMRAEGEPRIAMMTMVVPAVINFILDPIFIAYLGWGIRGAALATTIGYMASGLFALWFFLFGKSELSLRRASLRLQWPLVKEIFSIGSITLARQGAISILAAVLNNALFAQGGETGVTIYGLITRVMMIGNFPVMGLIQGFLPIAGYNHGAGKQDRVRSVIRLSILVGSLMGVLILAMVFLIPRTLLGMFTTDQALLDAAVPALFIVFFATPTLSLQLIGSGYFQAIGRAIPALLLALTKQGFCLIPFLLILPQFFGLDGIWWSFPIADGISALLSAIFLWQALRQTHELQPPEESTTPPAAVPLPPSEEIVAQGSPGCQQIRAHRM